MLSQTRPYRFADCVGNNRIMNEMKELSKDLSFSSVMFMTGPTGAGKTNLSLIIAMLLNCFNPVRNEDGTQEPCGTCDSCLSVINETYCMDIVFKNGSEMGKEEVLALDDVVANSPVYSKNKVIILDEAQELSNKKAKGAALTFLEKKRKGVYIILCTMDESAFERAILDRGRTYRFKGFTESEIAEYLFKMADKIGKAKSLPDSFFGEPLITIAKNAFGSMRSALKLFDACIDSKLYDAKSISEELGLVSNSDLYELFYGILNKDKKVIELMQKRDLLSVLTLGRKVLLGAFGNKVAGKEDKLAKLPGLEKIADIFFNENIVYFNSDRFQYQVLKYMADSSPIQENTPRFVKV